MNWEIIGSTGEWAGAIAVVATLFYLARQISESNKFARTSATKEIYDGFVGLNQLILSTPELAASLAKLKERHSEFSPAETVQLEHYCYRYLAMYMAAQTAFDNGHLSRADFELWKGDMRSIFGVYPGLAYYFKVILDRDGAGRSETEIINELRIAVDGSLAAASRS